MDQRYKIMQLTGSLAIGGAEKLILSLAEHIDPEKFEVHVCAFGKPKANSYLEEFQNLKQPGLRISSRNVTIYKFMCLEIGLLNQIFSILIIIS